MSELRHRVVDANRIRIHMVEQGEGPMVLFVHGFPESWYSWRHQLPALAAAGFRAVAIDVRGYGRSSKPHAIDEYRMLKHVADNVGVVEALGEEQAVIVGHDWGSPIAANSALLRPDMFRAVALLSVPYSPRSEHRPTDAYGALGGDEEFYISYFQEPGRAEAEIEADVRSWLLGFYFSASGDAGRRADGGTMATVKPGGRLRDSFTLPDKLPAWLSEADLAFYVGEFERSGFRGPLNRYRNVDQDWDDLAAFTHRPVGVPALFIGGERDGPTRWGAGAISRFDVNLPALADAPILPGCGHWVQQERADDVNELLLEFLRRTR
jgi:pimeloyl-ACP methyl ester carboxylesterase